MREVVPCNGCTACCHNEALILHPECGDVVESYETDPYVSPLTGEPVRILKHKPNGDCIYLGESGCTIHDRAPAICREFDCRRFFLKFTRNERRELVRKGMLDANILAAGRDRLSSLDRPLTEENDHGRRQDTEHQRQQRPQDDEHRRSAQAGARPAPRAASAQGR